MSGLPGCSTSGLSLRIGFDGKPGCLILHNRFNPLRNNGQSEILLAGSKHYTIEAASKPRGSGRQSIGLPAPEFVSFSPKSEQAFRNYSSLQNNLR
jgi:hypothetical protein